jgi:hypothetical protein
VTGRALRRCLRCSGRSEKSFEQFCISPDGAHIAFYGDEGTAVLVSARTKQWVANLKMPGLLRAMAFTGDGNLVAGCDDGVVHTWDCRMRRCVSQFVDEGSTGVTSVAVSPNSQFVATGCGVAVVPLRAPLWRRAHGVACVCVFVCALRACDHSSKAGVVNVYRSEDLTRLSSSTTLLGPKAPTPAKAIMNLTSRIDMLRFNHTSEMLAASSQSVKDAMRIVSPRVLHVVLRSLAPHHHAVALCLRRSTCHHCQCSATGRRARPRCTTYRAPSSRHTAVRRFAGSATGTVLPRPLTQLAPCVHRACVCAAGYLGVGNDRGRVLLYRVNHFNRS